MDADRFRLSADEEKHARIMRGVARALADTPLTLKGGTALLLCHGLDRFSEDLDFDAPKKISVRAKTEEAFKAMGATLLNRKVLKDTETVYRERSEYGYGGFSRSLKLEVSFRNPPSEDEVTIIGGIRVATIPRLIHQKLLAAHDGVQPRSVVRDLYDLHFLGTRHAGAFPAESVVRFRDFAGDPVRLVERYRADYEEDSLVSSHIALDDLALAVHAASLNLHTD